MQNMDAKGLLGGLMDFSFSEFITTRVIKVLYILSILMAALVALGMLIRGAQSGPGGAFLGLIAGALVFFIYVLFARVWLEIIIVVFRIAENTRDLRTMVAEHGVAGLGGPPAPEPAAQQTAAAKPSPEEPEPGAEPEAGATGPPPEDVAGETAEESPEEEDDGLEFELE
jgi:hypothetical protein